MRLKLVENPSFFSQLLALAPWELLFDTFLVLKISNGRFGRKRKFKFWWRLVFYISRRLIKVRERMKWHASRFITAFRQKIPRTVYCPPCTIDDNYGKELLVGGDSYQMEVLQLCKVYAEIILRHFELRYYPTVSLHTVRGWVIKRLLTKEPASVDTTIALLNWAQTV